jgi:hypothetical protein|tara:strand:+ start:519 stop:722 length:204 start_codon:yes stop_codon:yes gene_type:complete
MTGKFTLELEGDAYTDGLATADKFLAVIQDRLSKIEELVETNIDAVENLAGAIESLENARKALTDDA